MKFSMQLRYASRKLIFENQSRFFADNDNESLLSLPGDPFPSGLLPRGLDQPIQPPAAPADISIDASTESKMDEEEASKPKNGFISQQKESPRSCFNPSQFQSEKLCIRDANKPLEPSAILAANQTLLANSARALAMHLAALNCQLLSIQLDHEYPGLPDIRSGIHLLTLVEGRQLRLDVMERFLCLRYFVLITIFR